MPAYRGPLRPKFGFGGRWDSDPLSPPGFAGALFGDPAYGPAAAGTSAGLLSPDMVDPGGGGGYAKTYSGDTQAEYGDQLTPEQREYLFGYWKPGGSGGGGWQGFQNYWNSGFGAARPGLQGEYEQLLARLKALEGGTSAPAPGGAPMAAGMAPTGMVPAAAAPASEGGYLPPSSPWMSRGRRMYGKLPALKAPRF